jgi:hypothetical protein
MNFSTLAIRTRRAKAVSKDRLCRKAEILLMWSGASRTRIIMTPTHAFRELHRAKEEKVVSPRRIHAQAQRLRARNMVEIITSGRAESKPRSVKRNPRKIRWAWTSLGIHDCGNVRT